VLVCDDRRVLSSTSVFAADGLQLYDVACRHPAGPGREIERAGTLALVFVRRGCFVRSVAGVQSLLDSTVAYAMSPGEEQRFDHPHGHGDDCTVLSVDRALAASLWGGDWLLPTAPVPVGPQLDLEHRRLLNDATRQEDGHELFERAIVLGARLLEAVDARRVGSGRPKTARRRRVLVDEARQALAGDPELSLAQMAQALSVSPHHLSRVFRATTGATLARHRMRLRVREAMCRLAGGERDLARLAADVGFSDQSHLCRVVRSETGTTPSALRGALQTQV
jgi:AraC-like DNA-binding protein